MADNTSGSQDSVFSTRLSPETGAEVEAYAEDRGSSRSAALEVLIEEGLAVVNLNREEDAVMPAISDELEDVDEQLEEVTDELDRLSRNVSTVYRHLKELDLEEDPSEQFDGEW
jgi:hypothetical protein